MFFGWRRVSSSKGIVPALALLACIACLHCLLALLLALACARICLVYAHIECLCAHGKHVFKSSLGFRFRKHVLNCIHIEDVSRFPILCGDGVGVEILSCYSARDLDSFTAGVNSSHLASILLVYRLVLRVSRSSSSQRVYSTCHKIHLLIVTLVYPSIDMSFLYLSAPDHTSPTWRRMRFI